MKEMETEQPPPTVRVEWNDTTKGKAAQKRAENLEARKLNLERELNELGRKKEKLKEKSGYFPPKETELDEQVQKIKIGLDLCAKEIVQHDEWMSENGNRWIQYRIAEFPQRIHTLQTKIARLKQSIDLAVQKSAFTEAAEMKRTLDNDQFDLEVLERNWRDWTGEDVPTPKDPER